ncbi:hypothetical protein SAMN05444395_101321 [Flavobacterium fryxellicola]|uniref:Bacterial Pleckstrin homology domain-containing protein n=1 Tax=Flavobacterium fryxellicola TaxID=249352 RepID=A0A167XPG7_9FLAO|nr:hypothetical protein [Flavobacterium fryxellicola]OAB28567.1 hypothetical protein FBFR_07685 [Flavobacterium fryxellicola]SHN51952.1 hypothetical protein SAMN05444395_101321 [Flavobacterium fryxellicola]
MKTEFKEEQKFTQWWLWLILIGIALFPVYGIYKQIFLGEIFGDKPMSDVGLTIFAIVMFLIVMLFWLFKLKTEINTKEIRIQFFPLANRIVEWKDVKSAQVLNYGFVGGWGIRLFTKYGTVYNTKGNKGLAIELKNGKKLLVGTQKMDALTEVIRDINSFNKL